MNCAHCGKEFRPNPRVKKQEYCSAGECQRARRNRMQRMKMATDSDYRENEKRCQREWRDKNPDYWGKYRASHPGYVERNRILQIGRNARRREGKTSGLIAKMYSLDQGFYSRRGRVCKLIPQGSGLIAKMYPLTVRIVPVEDG